MVREVSRRRLHDARGDAEHWRGRPPAERLAAVEDLRRRHHGWDDAPRPRLQRVCRLLRAHEVRFLIVGGYAVALHGHPRYTGDLDVWVMVDPANVDRLLAALDDFGFGAVGLSPEDFLRRDQVVQLGYPPLRIDLLLDGVEFADCYAHRVEVDLGEVTAPFISLPDLRRNKAASGRPQDLADLQALAD